jgi:uncharacterized protein (TIGR00730 family)
MDAEPRSESADHRRLAGADDRIDGQPDDRARNQDLIQSIHECADKLAKDGSTRGDLKILSRTLRELRYAFKVFVPYRHQRKVTIFGSARTPVQSPAYQQALQFARSMAEQQWMVITGAASGIMEAGHVGAGRDHAMGLNILLPFEQRANPVITGDKKLVHMKYFFTRKLMFVKECDAVVCLPGGFGTLDEALEVLTLLQTGKHDMMPLVFLDAPGGSYWQELDHFFRRQLLDAGMISPPDISLYRITDSWETAVGEIQQFYRVYHSMRYVKQDLVLRLAHPLDPAFVEHLDRHFADIREHGHLQQRDALPLECEETRLANLPRLVLAFNRRDLGRLRQLIDCINRGAIADEPLA